MVRESCLLIAGGDVDGLVRVWEVTPQKSFETKILRTLNEHSASVHGVAITPQRVISVANDKVAKVWDTRTGNCLTTISGHDRGIRCLAVGGERLATGGADKHPRIWELATGEEIQVLKGSMFQSGHTAEVTHVAFHKSDPNILITSSIDKSIRMWDISKGKVVHSFKGHITAVNSFAVIDTGLISVSGDGSIMTWEWNSPKPVAGFAKHKGSVWCIDVLGKMALTGGEDWKVIVWDISKPSALEPLATLRGHKNTVCAVKLLSGTIGLSGGCDSSIRIWDLTTSMCLKAIQTDSWIYALDACSIELAEQGQGEHRRELSSENLLATLSADAKAKVAKFRAHTESLPELHHQAATADEDKPKKRKAKRSSSDIHVRSDRPESAVTDHRRHSVGSSSGIDVPAVSDTALQEALFPKEVGQTKRKSADMSPMLSERHLSTPDSPSGSDSVLGRDGSDARESNHLEATPEEEELRAQVPEHFVCPITQDIMTNPHVASDGYTYEKTAIKAWLKKNKTSPMTGEKLKDTNLIPNRLVKSQIEEFRDLATKAKQQE